MAGKKQFRFYWCSITRPGDKIVIYYICMHAFEKEIDVNYCMHSLKLSLKVELILSFQQDVCEESKEKNHGFSHNSWQNVRSEGCFLLFAAHEHKLKFSIRPDRFLLTWLVEFCDSMASGRARERLEIVFVFCWFAFLISSSTRQTHTLSERWDFCCSDSLLLALVASCGGKAVATVLPAWSFSVWNHYFDKATCKLMNNSLYCLPKQNVKAEQEVIM